MKPDFMASGGLPVKPDTEIFQFLSGLPVVEARETPHWVAQ